MDPPLLSEKFEARLAALEAQAKQAGAVDHRVPLLATEHDVEATIFPPGGRVNTAQAWTMTKAAFTKIPYDVKDYDPFNDFDVTTNYNYTARAAGKYLATATATITMATAGKFAILAIYVDEAEESRGGRFEAHSAMSLGVLVTDILNLSAGSTVDIRLYHDEAADKSLTAGAVGNHFAIHLMGV